MTANWPLETAGRARPVDKWKAAPRPPTSPQAQHQQRSIDVLLKSVNLICYRHFRSVRERMVVPCTETFD